MNNKARKAVKFTILALCLGLVSVFAVTSCEKLRNNLRTDELVSAVNNLNNIDYSNIDNLYAQPLWLIQNCIHGKWKVIETYRRQYDPFRYPTGLFVDIDVKNNSVEVTADSAEYEYLHFGWTIG